MCYYLLYIGYGVEVQLECRSSIKGGVCTEAPRALARDKLRACRLTIGSRSLPSAAAEVRTMPAYRRNGNTTALCVARAERDRVVRGGVALECGPGPIQVGMILHEVEPAVPPVPDTAVPKRDWRSAGAAAYALHDNRERPVTQLLDILDLYGRIGERLKPAGEKALQAPMAFEDGHIGGSERRHVPHGVFVKELQQPVEAALVPVLEPAARQACVRCPSHSLSLGAVRRRG
jgi:hypothetical protein